MFLNSQSRCYGIVTATIYSSETFSRYIDCREATPLVAERLVFTTQSRKKFVCLTAKNETAENETAENEIQFI